MNPNIIKTFRMSPQTLMQIDQHEKANFSKPANLFDRICRVLPGDGAGDVMLKYIICGSDDRTITLVYDLNGVEDGKRIPCYEKGSLGYELFIHSMTTAVVSEATKNFWPFEHAYMMAQMLSSQIDIDDKSTFPDYVERITPAMIDMNTEGFSFDVYRSVLVGEQRSGDFVQVNRAIVRSVARPVTQEMSNNFHEIYPVMRMGNFVTFNGYVPFPAQILHPMCNESELPAAERNALYFKDSVMVCELRDADRVLDVRTGTLSRGHSL